MPNLRSGLTSEETLIELNSSFDIRAEQDNNIIDDDIYFAKDKGLLVNGKLFKNKKLKGYIFSAKAQFNRGSIGSQYYDWVDDDIGTLQHKYVSSFTNNFNTDIVAYDSNGIMYIIPSKKTMTIEYTENYWYDGDDNKGNQTYPIDMLSWELMTSGLSTYFYWFGADGNFYYVETYFVNNYRQFTNPQVFGKKYIDLDKAPEKIYRAIPYSGTTITATIDGVSVTPPAISDIEIGLNGEKIEMFNNLEELNEQKQFKYPIINKFKGSTFNSYYNYEEFDASPYIEPLPNGKFRLYNPFANWHINLGTIYYYEPEE